MRFIRIQSTSLLFALIAVSSISAQAADSRGTSSGRTSSILADNAYLMTGISPDFRDDFTPLMPGYWADGLALPITLPPEPAACAVPTHRQRHAGTPLACPPLTP
ncbi:hypothetical protein [Beijerinckia mobilis]|uniref:hypothetical protein n=1 Tax=Beijerinckia mobilis TaxID=231434 RepID=UPI0012EC33B0|nr:hypothetical protein [Beijerinckia mobilis]